MHTDQQRSGAMESGHVLPGTKVLGARVTALGWRETLDVLAGWAAHRESRYVCVSNVHMVVTAQKDAMLAEAMRMADMCTPDGAPIAWMLRRLGFDRQPRISGTELMLAYFREAAQRGESVFLLGSTEQTLAALVSALGQRVPGLRVAGAYSPPFRPASELEDAALVDHINDSGARTVWVSLGCPKQEKWMLAHRGRVRAVMFGVGAAFDFVAGAKPRAPQWMQKAGLEWLHRFASEPGRLWKRYLVTNTLFLLGAARQLVFRRSKG
ncbi:MAG: WecB/TagA/CpsF family glycosyltransferase [Rhodoferax sp.]|nr:WecB/TagA/CpsF family glycosyltransferase [Rhodoferax sp.]